MGRCLFFLKPFTVRLSVLWKQFSLLPPAVWRRILVCLPGAWRGKPRTWSGRGWPDWSSLYIGRRLFFPFGPSALGGGWPLFVRLSGSWPVRTRPSWSDGGHGRSHSRSLPVWTCSGTGCRGLLLSGHRGVCSDSCGGNSGVQGPGCAGVRIRPLWSRWTCAALRQVFPNPGGWGACGRG